MKKYILLLLLATTTWSYAQNIVINEVQAKNINTYRGPYFFEKFLDWIELKNTTATAIDISGYYLSDDEDDVTRWAFPAGTTLPANSFLIVHAGGEIDEFSTESGTFYNTNFKLSSSGKSIILTSDSTVEVDRIDYPLIQNDISYGRLPDGSLSFMNNPTPGEANNEGSAFTEIASDISISTPSGLYDSSQTVTISNSGKGNIYYTIDGTTPNNSATLYTGPVTIGTNTTLKVIVAESASAYSLVENRSYIFGASHDLPIVILTSDNSSFNSDNKEIIDGRVHFKFIETDGSEVISQYANFNTSGNTSTFYPQLNGKVKSNKAYGEGSFNHKMYPNKKVDEFKSFLFRNASQDWANTHFRDAFVSRLIGQDNLTDTPFEAYRPAVLYVNAKYQGIINIREDDDSDYVKHNFDLDDDEFETKLSQGGIIAFEYKELNFNDEADRATFRTIVDFNELLSLNLVTAYAAPGEFGWQVWKDTSGKTGTQFHYNFHDFDPIYGLAFDGANFTEFDTNPMTVNQLLGFNSQIRDYTPYKHEGIHFIMASLNHIYNTERSFEIIEDMKNELLSEIPAHAAAMTALANARTPIYPANQMPFATSAEWLGNIEDLKTNIAAVADANLFTRIKNEYGLDDPIEITYNSSNINHGLVVVHDVKSIKETFTGTYFQNIPIRFTTIAKPGYQFVRWEGDVISTNLEITPTFSSNANITAVFEPLTVPSISIVINEVQGKNDNTITDESGEFDDWIEIYNPDDTPVNLANYYISDNPEEPLKFKIASTDASKTTVPANGFLLLWADKDLEQGENHLDFKIKASDEVILTGPDAVTLIQDISFSDIDTDSSYGAETDASTDYIVFTTPTPGVSNTKELSTNDFEKAQKISIYPNPVKNVININSKLENLSWELFDILGRSIKKGSSKIINVETLKQGLYLLQVENHETFKVLKN